ncbi:MAG: hypothetical protein LBI57_00450 [Helicobacteraceae bacterium]|nr:hypothetical protein [Helicobacteraceae bacterium]
MLRAFIVALIGFSGAAFGDAISDLDEPYPSRTSGSDAVVFGSIGSAYVRSGDHIPYTDHGITQMEIGAGYRIPHYQFSAVAGGLDCGGDCESLTYAGGTIGLIAEGIGELPSYLKAFAEFGLYGVRYTDKRSGSCDASGTGVSIAIGGQIELSHFYIGAKYRHLATKQIKGFNLDLSKSDVIQSALLTIGFKF